MSRQRQRLGEWGEAQARAHLASHGCSIVATNWRCQAGEVDVVALDDDCLAFVEVRARRGMAYGTPEESITPRKLARMAEVAQAYVYETGWDGPWRLDVVAVRVGHPSPQVSWYKNVTG